jgi:HlyD family secretion protein
MAAAAVLASCGREDPSLVQGYIEGEFVHVASPFGGQLERLFVERGTEVEQGAMLFSLDDSSEVAARNEAAARVEQAKSQLEDARQGQRPSEIRSIEAELAQARAALVLSEIELQRQSKLSASNVTSREEFDIALAQRDRDRQRVAQLEADLETAGLGSRDEQVKAAEKNLRSQEAALAGAEWNLSQKTQYAPQAALVHDTVYREGDWVEGSSPVVVLLPPGNVKVRVFVAQGVVGRLRLGGAAEVFIDGVVKPFAAKISYISPRAEFTPPVIFSSKMREKFVFMVELSVDPQTAKALHPGQPVDVRLSL